MYKITLKGYFYSLDIGEFDSLDDAVEYARANYSDVKEVYGNGYGWSV